MTVIARGPLYEGGPITFCDQADVHGQPCTCAAVMMRLPGKESVIPTEPPAGQWVDPVTEYAHQMSGGGFHVWNTEPYIEKIAPLAERIKAEVENGGKVWRRRVIVVEEWTEVTEP